MNNIKTLITLLACFVSMASAASQSNAVTISTDTGYTAIAAGESYTVALKADGSLWTWGSNNYSQLGDGTIDRNLVPKQIGTGYTAISAGRDHTVALKSDGSLWGWGSNGYGQLGDGTTTDSLAPKQIGTGYSAISSGWSYTIALKSDGSLWAWGRNNWGQLGDGTTAGSLVPKQIDTASYTAISAGADHTIALQSDGSLWAWGNNSYGELGDGTTADSLLPKRIGTASYSVISAGPSYSIAIKPDGSLWVWGSNYSGRLGDGNTFNGFQPYLTNVLAPKQIGTGYAAIAAGETHTLALKSDGSLWAWGGNGYGQLGYATTTRSLVPKQIGTDSYSAIATGGYHTVALKPDGSLWAWGNNYYGQLGDGTTTNSLVSKQIIDTGYTPDIPDTAAPSVPTGLTVTPRITDAAANSVNLFWTPSTDDVGVNVYKIYLNGVSTGGTSANDAIATGLPTDRFTVSACDAAGNCSAQSAEASVTSSTQAPSVPSGLTASAVSATQINLAWTSSVNNTGITRYEVYRTSVEICVIHGPPGPTLECDTGPNHITRLVTTLSGTPPQTNYSDTGLSPSAPDDSYYNLYGSYSYFIRACDAVGNCSAASDTVSAQTQPLPVTLRTPPTAIGASYGPLTNQTIRITMTPPKSVPNLGAGTSIFVAAVVPTSMGGGTYFRNYNGWFPYTSCAAAPVSSWWGFDAAQQLDVVPTPTDLSSLKGTKIYVGYGIGTSYTTANDGIGATDAEACTDMLNNSTFTQAYTVN